MRDQRRASSFFVGASYTASTTYTYSVYLKAAGYHIAGVATANNAFPTDQLAIFDLSNGTVRAAAQNGSQTIQAIGNGWYRCSVSNTTGATTGLNFILNIPVYDNAGNFVFAGDGVSGVWAYGNHVEAGSFQTSYIPTTASAVTRATDVMSMPTNVSWYNSNVGSLFGEYIVEGVSSSYSAPLAFVGANANTGFITIDSFAPGTATSPKLGGSLITANGTNQSYTDNGGTITIVAGIIQKGIGGWSPGTGVRSAHNGVPPTTYIGVVTTPPTIVGLSVGGQVNSQFAASMWARRITYWPRVLSDTEMQQVTT